MVADRHKCVTVPNGTALHRGQIGSRMPSEIEADVAVPSGTALHRGNATGRQRADIVFVAVPNGTALH